MIPGSAEQLERQVFSCPSESQYKGSDVSKHPYLPKTSHWCSSLEKLRHTTLKTVTTLPTHKHTQAQKRENIRTARSQCFVTPSDATMTLVTCVLAKRNITMAPFVHRARDGTDKTNARWKRRGRVTDNCDPFESHYIQQAHHLFLPRPLRPLRKVC